MHLQNNHLYIESYPTSQFDSLERCHDTHSDYRVYTQVAWKHHLHLCWENRLIFRAILKNDVNEFCTWRHFEKTCLQNSLRSPSLFSSAPSGNAYRWGFGFGKKAHPPHRSYKRRSRKSSLRRRCSLSMWTANFDENCLQLYVKTQCRVPRAVHKLNPPVQRSPTRWTLLCSRKMHPKPLYIVT